MFAAVKSQTRTAGSWVNSTGIGSINWTPGTLPTTNDALNAFTPATVSLDDNQISRYLDIYNFGFDIPSNATIEGVIIEFIVYPTTGGGGVEEHTVQMIKTGARTGDNNAIAGTTIGGSSTGKHCIHGDVDDLWGLSLTPADCNISAFGFAVVLHKPTIAGGAQPINLLAPMMTICYSEPEGAGALVGLIG